MLPALQTSADCKWFAGKVKGGGLVNKKAENVPDWYAEAGSPKSIGAWVGHEVLVNT